MTAALTDPNAIPPLRRRQIPWPERPTVFCARWGEMPMSRILDLCIESGYRVVYVVAGPYASERPTRAFWMEPAVAGWHISGYTSDPPRVNYSRVCDGRDMKVDVQTTAPWFGHVTDRHKIFQAWNLLGGLTRGTWHDQHAHLMGTPSRTGLDLLSRCLPQRNLADTKIIDPAYGVYPVAPGELRQRIHNNAPQGRQEILPVNTRRSCLTWLDARWQYAACTSGLPVGTVEHVKTHAYTEHLPAFYFGRFRAPLDWPFAFGLLPELNGMDDEGPRFLYPHDRRWHVGWFTGAECELAMLEGWEVGISERISWDMTQPDPLKEWTDRLRRMRANTSDALVSAATRNILIGAIGSFARRATRELHVTPTAESGTIPDEAYPVHSLGETIEWWLDAPLEKSLESFQHPEWSWTIWGRSRRRVHMAALKYLRETDGGEIVTFRNDGFVVTIPPRWYDDGKIGAFRIKRQTVTIPVPRNESEYREILKRMGQEEDYAG